MRQILRLIALAFASALALTASARAQSDIVTTDRIQVPELAIYENVIAETAPDGGLVVAVLGKPFGVFTDRARILFVRYGPQGDRVWTRTVDAPPGEQHGFFRGIAVGPNGEAAVLTRPDRVECIAPDGTLRWSTGTFFGAGSEPRQTDSLFFDAEGNLLQVVVVTGGDVLVESLARDDGTVRWSRTYPGNPAVGTSFGVSARMRNNELFFAGCTVGGTQVVRLDADGNEIFRAVAPVGCFAAEMDVGPDGQTAVLAARVFGMSPTGALLFNSAYPPPLGPFFTKLKRSIVYHPDGDFTILHGFDRASRYDGAGQVEWTRQSSVTNAGFDTLIDVGGDRVAAVASALGVDFVQWIGPEGEDQGRQDLSGLAASSLLSLSATADARGNVQLAFRDSFSAAVAAKVVFGGEQGAPGCSQPTPNSTGAFGRLEALGSGVARDDNLTLRASDLPANQTTLFLNALGHGSLPGVSGGAGTLCLGASLSRYLGPDQVRLADQDGEAVLQLDLRRTPSGAALVQVLAGETWYFQAWHRDTAAFGGSHMTNSISVAFD